MAYITKQMKVYIQGFYHENFWNMLTVIPTRKLLHSLGVGGGTRSTHVSGDVSHIFRGMNWG